MHPGPTSHFLGPVPASIMIIVLLLPSIASVSAAAPDLTASIGEPVRLSGKALVTDQVYLFLTGPGLAHNGVNLNRINVPVVTGEVDTFTIVPVENDRWQYNWQTTRLGKTLKEGTYRVYMATEPVGREDLDRMGVRYNTIDIRFTSGSPEIAASVSPSVPSTATRPNENETKAGLPATSPSQSFTPTPVPQPSTMAETTVPGPTRTSLPAGVIMVAAIAAGLISLPHRKPPY